MTDRRDDYPEESKASPSSGEHGEAETIDLSVLSGGPSSHIGPYRLVKQIGEGGMGVVYQAEQEEPVRRSVALKIVKPGMDSERVMARFEAERNALALMDHPHIAHVIDVGLADPTRPYFVMELVLGLPITEYCDKQRMGIRERARLLVTVCRAVQHAHQKGIIHRDIKPSNVIVCDSDSGPLPKVIDFGVAKAVNAHDLQETEFTLDGHAVGTPLYMSPEQARLANSDIDTRSDVYSLGVLFYELLTGTTPILSSRLREMDLHDLRRVIRREDPPLPSARLRELGDQLAKVAEDRGTDPRGLIQSVRGDLDQVVDKAMAKDRVQRYPTANALARDIERYLDRLPIEATAPSAWYRLKRVARRNLAAFATICLVASILIVATLVSIWQAYQKHAALATAQVAAAKLSERLYLSDMKVASDAWKDADPPRVAGLLGRHVPLGEATDHRHFEWYYLSAQVGVQGVEIEATGDDVETIRISRDGEQFAAASRDGKIRIYDATSYARRLTLDAGFKRINDVSFTRDGQSLISAGDDGTLNIWDLGTGERSRDPIPAHRNAVRALVFGGEGDLLVSCGDDKRICLWDLSEGICEGELEGHTREVESLAVSPDGWLLASAASDGTIGLWDLKSRQPLRPPIRHSKARVVCVAFSHDGRSVAAGDVYGNVTVYDVPTGRPKLTVRQLDGVENVVFLSDDRWLAAGDRGGSIQLWPVATDGESDYEHGQETFPRWQIYDSRVTALALSPDGEYLISGSRSGEICRWSARLETCRWSLGGVNRPVRDFACAKQGRQVAAVGPKGIELWDLDQRTQLATWAEDEGPWGVAAVSPARDVLVVGDDQGQLVAWQLDTQTELARWESADSVRWDRIVFAPDGRRFAAAAWDRLTEAWIFDLDAPGQRWQVPARQSKSVAFHPDGKRFAVAWMDDGRLYDWRTQKLLHSFYGHSNTLSDLTFSPDGRTLATVGHGRKLRMWDPATGKELYAIVAHRDWVRSVTFAPDGWSLATAGDDRVVRIWHVETGQLLMELPDEGHGIEKVRFTPDGRNLICRTKDNRIVIYDSKHTQTSLNADN